MLKGESRERVGDDGARDAGVDESTRRSIKDERVIVRETLNRRRQREMVDHRATVLRHQGPCRRVRRHRDFLHDRRGRIGQSKVVRISST